MFKPLACSLIFLSAFSHASEPCKFEAARNANLDLTGVRTVVVQVHQQNVHLTGTAAAAGQVRGRACASTQDLLPGLQVVQRREGDRLIVEAKDNNAPWHGVVLFGSHYDYLDLHVDVPAGLAVEVDVGSGDAWVKNVAQLKTEVGSGDIDIDGVRGGFEARVGSGDIKAVDVGDTHVTAVGSGDFNVRQVRGNITLGNVSSGDFTADGVKGNVSIGSIGSGDATARGVGGSVEVGSIGSGDLHVDGVAHDLHVASVGSGDVEHHGVAGKVNVPKDD